MGAACVWGVCEVMPALPAEESCAEAALRYASIGWPVFPLHWVRDGHCSCGVATCTGNAGKHPLTAHGFKDATTDPKQIAKWWERWPSANVGIATGSGLLVLDIDPKNGGTSAGFDLPDTPRVVTQSRGEHHYFRVEGAVGCSVGQVAAGLDVRADGGYVVAPPSVGLQGQYGWDVGSPEEFAACPRWLLERAQRPRVRERLVGGAADAYISGGRNNALTSLAGTMVRRGMCPEAIESALLAENAHRCQPPLDEREVQNIAQSVGKYDPSAPVQPGADPWKVVGAAALSEALAPIAWVCEGLRIAPGPITLVAGYGYSAKTIALQAMALAIAAGTLVWGIHSAQQGGVIHIDYEQGRRLTQERYQRLALGMNVDLAELGEALQVACLPDLYLDGEGVMAQLRDLLAGKRLAIIDSMRAAFPALDENSSEARRWLDMLTRVSEETGCAIIVIHHARKAQKDAVGGSSQSIRGSGAIFDACQGVFVFGARKGEPVKVEHVKERLGGRNVEDFYLEVEDVSGVSLDPEHDGRVVENAGVRVRIGAPPAASMAVAVAKGEALDARIIDCVAQLCRAGAPPSGNGVLAALKAAGGVDRNMGVERIRVLKQQGVLRQVGGGLEVAAVPVVAEEEEDAY